MSANTITAAQAAPALDIAPLPSFDSAPQLVERVRALDEEVGRQDVTTVQDLEQAQKTSMAQTLA